MPPILCLCCLCFFGRLLFSPARFARKDKVQNDSKYQ